jgi:polysaccharide biosynthesis/export protein
MKTQGFVTISAAMVAATCVFIPVSVDAQSRDAALAPAAASNRPLSTPSSVAGSATVSAAKEYRLTAGDKLRIEVYKDAQLSQSVQIRPDGKITLPLLGRGAGRHTD